MTCLQTAGTDRRRCNLRRNRRQTPPRRPKLEPFTGVIDQILVDDLRRPRKQRHTAQRIFRRLRDEHGLGRCCWTLEVVRAEVQGIRVESVLPCLRARPGGLLEREDVRAVQAYSTCSGARLPLPTRAKRGGPTATRRRPDPLEKRNTGKGPILYLRATAAVCVRARADTVIDNRFYVVFPL